MAWFKAFHIWTYKDLKDLVEQLQDMIQEENFNPQNIYVCIWDNTQENIEAQKEMLKNMFNTTIKSRNYTPIN